MKKPHPRKGQTKYSAYLKWDYLIVAVGGIAFIGVIVLALSTEDRSQDEEQGAKTDRRNPLQQKQPPTFQIGQGQAVCEAVTSYCNVQDKKEGHGECSKSIISQLLGNSKHWDAIQREGVAWEFFFWCNDFGIKKKATPNTVRLEGMLEVALTKAAMRQDYTVEMDSYNEARKELSEAERVEHYRWALVRLPHSLFVNDALALALKATGNAAAAKALLEQAVARRVFDRPDQRPTNILRRGLAARAWWDPAQFAWVAGIEAAAAEMSAELQAEIAVWEAQAEANSPRYGADFFSQAEGIHAGGEWSEMFVVDFGRPAKGAQARFPKTLAAVEAAGAPVRGGFLNAKFSIMEPGTHVKPHCGVANTKLRAHICLAGCSGASIRVGDEERSWNEGKVIIFDDSFEHEVWHKGKNRRAVLIMDFFHPELPAKERRQLQDG